jgi:hypothetical protein
MRSFVDFMNLASAAESDSLISPAVNRLALLTGQSMPSNTALRPEQIAFLRSVAPADVDALPHGFPFLRSREFHPTVHPALVPAAYNNTLQYLAAGRSPAFRAGIAARLTELFAKTQGTLLLITGSCGLRLLDAAWPLIGRTSERFHILALGPAHRGQLALPKDRITTVRGTRDGWSAALFSGAIDHQVPCGHLDYWTCTSTIALVRALLADALAAAQPT